MTSLLESLSPNQLSAMNAVGISSFAQRQRSLTQTAGVEVFQEPRYGTPWVSPGWVRPAGRTNNSAKKN